MIETTEQITKVRRRRLRGVVVKAAMEKTVTVRIDRLISHKRLKRVMRRSRKYLVHDANGIAHIGDTVEIEDSRPFSKRKKWRVINIIKAAQREEVDGLEDDNAEAVIEDKNATNKEDTEA